MGSRILVVDDEAMVREAVVALLGGENYRVATAASGEEGVEAVRKVRFHLVLLDLRMPGMGGLDALRQMKAHDPELPVVILTGDSDIESAKKAIRSGAADYLTKPVEPTRFLDLISKNLRSHSSDSAGTVAVVDDDPEVLQSIMAVLQEADITARAFSRGDEALRAILQDEAKVLLTDLRLADTDGLRLLQQARQARPDLVSILYTGYPSVETTVAALRLGAMDYLPKPIPPDRLLEVVRRALEKSHTDHLPGGLVPGRAYRLREGKTAAEVFSSLISRGLAGLWISRSPPGREALASATFLRLGYPGEAGLPSVSDPEKLVLAVEAGCSKRRTIVLLDGLDYLASHSNFETTYRTLTLLRDIVSAKDCILLVLYTPSAFTERERTLIERELEELEGGGERAVWEEKAAGLHGDAKILYDLVRATGGQRHQADLIAATGFSKARVTRLLQRMEVGDLLRRQRDGMGNLVILA